MSINPGTANPRTKSAPVILLYDIHDVITGTSFSTLSKLRFKPLVALIINGIVSSVRRANIGITCKITLIAITP